MASLQPMGSMLETSCGSPHYACPEVIRVSPIFQHVLLEKWCSFGENNAKMRWALAQPLCAHSCQIISKTHKNRTNSFNSNFKTALLCIRNCFYFWVIRFFRFGDSKVLKKYSEIQSIKCKIAGFFIFCHLFFVQQRTIILGCFLLIDRSLPGLFDTIFCRKCYIQREQLINIYELQCSIQGFYCQFHARFGASSTKTYILRKKVDFCDKSKFFYRAKNTMAGGQMSGLVVWFCMPCWLEPFHLTMTISDNS